MQLQITDERTLQEASAYLHDAVLARGQIHYDPTAKTLTLDVWREIWEETTSKRFFLILQRWIAPHVRCHVTFEKVSACKMDFTEELEHYQISRLDFDPRSKEMLIVGVCCFEIKLALDSLEGRVADSEERTTKQFNKTTIGFTKPPIAARGQTITFHFCDL